MPAEMAALRAPGAPAVTQMLYRFWRAGTNAEVNADIAAIRAISLRVRRIDSYDQ